MDGRRGMMVIYAIQILAERQTAPPLDCRTFLRLGSVPASYAYSANHR